MMRGHHRFGDKDYVLLNINVLNTSKNIILINMV